MPGYEEYAEGMKPSYSVTFLLDGEHWQVPFQQEHAARAYVTLVQMNYPDATNVLVNDLSV